MEKAAVVRVNRGIVKLIHRSGTDLNLYRLYIIARTHFAFRSGIFSLEEFCDLLHADYGYKSLHHGVGSDRRKFIRKTAAQLRTSQLFTPLTDGRFRIRSERTILTLETREKRTGWYEIPEPRAILSSRRKFADFCIGAMLAGNKFRANKNISKIVGCTGRRIQYATSRNHKGSTFFKQYNFIEDISGTYEEVMRHRAILLNVHGITTPLPKHSSRGVWAVRLNAPNSYRAIVLSGVKGRKAQPPVKTVRKSDSWFIPRNAEKDEQLNLFKKSHTRDWIFNEKLYTSGTYLLDHSRMFDRGGI